MLPKFSLQSGFIVHHIATTVPGQNPGTGTFQLKPTVAGMRGAAILENGITTGCSQIADFHHIHYQPIPTGQGNYSPRLSNKVEKIATLQLGPKELANSDQVSQSLIQTDKHESKNRKANPRTISTDALKSRRPSKRIPANWLNSVFAKAQQKQFAPQVS